jgi:hypothetical protein
LPIGQHREHVGGLEAVHRRPCLIEQSADRTRLVKQPSGRNHKDQVVMPREGAPDMLVDPPRDRIVLAPEIAKSPCRQDRVRRPRRRLAGRALEADRLALLAPMYKLTKYILDHGKPSGVKREVLPRSWS